MAFCNTTHLTLYWPQADLELRPYSAELKSDRDEFNWLQAKFSKEVGEHIEPHTKTDDGALREGQPVHVKIEGTKRYQLYFRPEYVDYGTENCWIELHDPQKHLKETIIDEKWKNVTLKEAYKRIFERATGSKNILSGLKFGVPKGLETEIAENTQDSSVTLNDTQSDVEILGDSFIAEEFLGVWDKQTRKVLKGNYNIDVASKDGLEALWELNDKFSLTSWTDARGRLWVGQPENSDIRHVSAPDDKRVWRIEDANITHPREPIKKVVVKGQMMDAPNASTDEDIVESVTEFLNTDKGHQQDLMPQGVAQRTDIEKGQSIAINEPDAKRDSLGAIAYHRLLEELRKQNTGTVQINSPISGEMVSKVASVNVGEYLHVVPRDEKKGCGGHLQHNIYVITGVHHSFSGDSWDTNLDVMLYPNEPIATAVRYFDPMDDEYLTSEEVYG